LIYYRELQEQGVKSEIVVYPGVPHGFDGFFAQIGQAQKFLKDRSAWITSLLGK
jgi:acetyl esterase/lipase